MESSGNLTESYETSQSLDNRISRVKGRSKGQPPSVPLDAGSTYYNRDSRMYVVAWNADFENRAFRMEPRLWRRLHRTRTKRRVRFEPDSAILPGKR